MSNISGVSSSTQNSTTDAVKKVLGKDDFLKLLITQLKYQDPMEPTDNKDFIAQMAQFSSLEQMTNMSNGFENLAAFQESMLREMTVGQAVNMIGRTATAVLPVEQVTGKVTGGTDLFSLASNDSQVLKSLSDQTAVTVLGTEGDMYKVRLADGTTGYINQNDVELDENPRVTGVVTGMKLVDGVPSVVINGQVISISYIEQVNVTESTDADTQGGEV